MSKSTIITTLVLFTLTISTASSASLPLEDVLNFDNGVADLTQENEVSCIPDADTELIPLPLFDDSMDELELLNLGWCKYPTNPSNPTPLPEFEEYDLGL